MPRPAPRVAPATRATRPVSGFWKDLFFAMLTFLAPLSLTSAVLSQRLLHSAIPVG